MIRIHFNLLVCLDALLTERSVTRAAQKLDMSQPGMSNALARLRQLTGDPLLIRTPQGFVLTERAEVLAEKVRASMALMEEILANETPVDPRAATGTVTIAAPDSVGISVIPAAVEAVATEAPKVHLEIRLPDPDRLRDWLVEGECDLALGYFPGLPADLRSCVLFTQSLSCIRGKQATAAGPLTMDDFLQATHVVFGSPFSSRSTMETTIEEALGSGGHARERVVRVASLPSVAYIVARSRHIATLPTWMAHHYASFLPVDVQELPFEVPPIECRMVWHDRTHRQGLPAFVRDVVRRVSRDLVSDSGSLLGVGISAPR